MTGHRMEWKKTFADLVTIVVGVLIGVFLTLGITRPIADVVGAARLPWIVA